MKTLKLMLAGAALALSAAPVAHAGAKILATAPALSGYPNTQTLYCTLLNLNSTPAEATIDIMGYFGAVVTGFTFSGVGAILPSQRTAVGDGSGNGAWCRFTVIGNPKKFRGAAVYDDGSGYTVGIPAF